jgi:hypothetical protein
MSSNGSPVKSVRFFQAKAKFWSRGKGTQDRKRDKDEVAYQRLTVRARAIIDAFHDSIVNEESGHGEQQDFGAPLACT